MGKKKSNYNRVIIFTLLIVSAIAITFYYLKFYDKNYFIKYGEFGIHIPTNYAIHGIDVSRHQKRISWKDVEKMNVDGIRFHFAFIKATEGVESVDEHFKKNWKNIRKTKLYAGAYHFFIATKSGKAQAVNFIKTVHLTAGDLPPVLDVEEHYGVKSIDIVKRVKDWLFLVERAYGVKPIIYTNVDFYKKYLKGNFDEYPLWIAHYHQQVQPRIEREWLFWQHSDVGQVDGINTYVDFNVFSGDSMQLQQLLIP